MKFLMLFILLVLSTNLYSNNSKEIIKNFEPTKEEIKNGAVIIKKDVKHELDKDNNSKSTYYYLIALLDKKAIEDYTHISIPFNSYYKDYKIDFARIISKDGVVNELKKDALQIKTPNNNMYNDTKIIEFSLPSMKNGSFIEYKLTFNSKKQLINKHWSKSGYIGRFHINNSSARIDSVRSSKIEVSIPKTNKLFTKFYNIKVKPKIKTVENKKIYSWQFNDISKFDFEDLTAISYYRIVPNYSFSTMKNWSVLNNQFNEIFNEKVVVDSKIKNLASKITKNTKNDEEKIEKIYKYLQENIKYVFANFGSGGFTPHSTHEILENLYGDCKDQSILFISLLRAVGIEAHPTIVNASLFTKFDKEIVMPQYFNHMITYIPSKNLWVDTTGSNFTFPGTSVNTIDKNSLIIKDKVEIKKITNKLENEILITKRYDYKNNNQLLNVEIDFKGAYSDHYKALYSQYDSKLTDMYESFFAQLYNSATIKDFKFTNIKTNDKNVKLIFNVKSNGEIDLDNKTTPIATYYGGLDSFILEKTTLRKLKKPENTKYGFILGIKGKIKTRTILSAPSDESKGTFTVLPKTYDNKYFTYSFMQRNISNNIQTTSELTIKKRMVKPEDYKNFYKEASSLLSNSIWQVNYKYDPFFKKQNQLKKGSDLKSKIDLAKSYLNTMQLEEAKSILDEHIDKNKNNYDLNYTYGVVLGLLGEDDLSEKYLNIADKIKN